MTIKLSCGVPITEISTAVDACAKHRLKGKNIEVHQVSVSRSIVVYQLPEGCTHDSVMYYFENAKRSAGGTVQRVEADHLGDGYCIVHFADHQGGKIIPFILFVNVLFLVIFTLFVNYLCFSRMIQFVC